MARSRVEITVDLVRSLFDYDAQTGKLTWRHREDLKPKAKAWNDRYAGKETATVLRKGHRYVSIYKQSIAAHRVIWFHVNGVWPKDQIDHINCIKTDNRFENLREADYCGNGHNVGLTKRNSSGHKGVYWSKAAQKWQVRITNVRVTHYLGIYDDLAEAAAVYATAAKKLHGEFARIA